MPWEAPGAVQALTCQAMAAVVRCAGGGCAMEEAVAIIAIGSLNVPLWAEARGGTAHLGVWSMILATCRAWSRTLQA